MEPAAVSSSTESGTGRGRIKPIEQGSVHRICAGQVVTSLAIAIKELVENAIDAGATVVEVRLREYGAESIEVVDNGAGIAPEDWAALTARHATSKIHAFEDVYSVASYGFRGEAVSSLCELSGSFSVLTRAAGHAVGTRLTYDRAGGLVGKEPSARAQGTTVTVTDLFKPLPVRRREFLKSVKKQYALALSVLQSYALIASYVRLLVVHTATGGSARELGGLGGGAGAGAAAAGGGRKSIGSSWGKEGASTTGEAAAAVAAGSDSLLPSAPVVGHRAVVLNTTGSGSMGAALTEVWGAKFTAGMVPIDITVPLPARASSAGSSSRQAVGGEDGEDGTGQEAEQEEGGALLLSSSSARIYGYVSKLDSGIGRSSSDRCFLYLSGRPVDLPRLGKVVADTWRAYELQHKPAVCLDVTGLPPGTWDINLSPDKREVLLQPAVEAVLHAAVRACLAELWEQASRSFAVSPLLQPVLAWEGGGGKGQGAGGASTTTSSTSERAAGSAAAPAPAAGSPLAASPPLVSARSLAPVPALPVVPPSPTVPQLQAGPAPTGVTIEEEDEGEQEEEVEVDLPPLRPPGPAHGLLSAPPGVGPSAGSGVASVSTSASASPGGAVGALLSLPSRRSSTSTNAAPPASPADPPPPALQQGGSEGKHGAIEQAEAEEKGEEEVDAYSVGAASGSTGTGSRALPRARVLHASPGHGHGRGRASTGDKEGAGGGDRKRAKVAADAPIEAVVTGADVTASEEMEDEDDADMTLGQLQQASSTVSRPATTACTACPGPSHGSSDAPQHQPLPSPAPAPTPAPSRQVESVPLEACTALYAARAQARAGAGSGAQPRIFDTFTDSDSDAGGSSASSTHDRRGTGTGAVHAGLGAETSSSSTDPSASPLPSPTDAEHMLSTRLLTKDAFPSLARGCVGQFNLGFLVARRGGDLYILDQHACDEKAQFERLVRDTVLHEQQLLVPLPCELTPSEESTVLAHLPLFAACGLHFTQPREGRAAGQRLALTAVPFSKGVSFGVEDVRELASLLAQAGPGGSSTMGGSASSAGGRPAAAVPLGDGRTLLGLQGRTHLPKVRTMLASRACRSAIMIGSALKRDVSRRVISSLAGLAAPWSCPHGRPTMRHLVDLGGLQGMGQAARGLLPPGPELPQAEEGGEA